MQEWKDLHTVHELKQSSKGLEVTVVPLILFSDDVSGNRSKKYNCFNNWALLLGGLSRQDNAKLKNIHFITASNKVKLLTHAK